MKEKKKRFYETVGEYTIMSYNIVRKIYERDINTIGALMCEEADNKIDGLEHCINEVEEVFKKSLEEIKKYKENR